MIELIETKSKKKFYVLLFKKIATTVFAIALFLAAAGSLQEAILFIIFGLIFTLYFVILISIIVTHYEKKQAFNSAAELTDHVKIVSKTLNVSGHRYSRTTYFVAVELSDRRRINFELDISIYNTVVENETGILTYRESDGHVFWVNFQRM